MASDMQGPRGRRAATAAVMLFASGAAVADDAKTWLSDQQALGRRIEAAARDPAAAQALRLPAFQVLGRVSGLALPSPGGVYCAQATQAMANYASDLSRSANTSAAAERRAWREAQPRCESAIRRR